MEPMSLNEWIASTDDTRDDCMESSYHNLYLDTGFFYTQFAGAELCLTGLLQVATHSTDPKAFNLLVSGMDARVKVNRFRNAAKLCGSIGPNLDARLTVFEKQSISLRNKLAHSVVLPHDTDDSIYEIVSILKQPLSVNHRLPTLEPPEKLRADRVWKHGVWLNRFVFDMATAIPEWMQSSVFEIKSPLTPVLIAGRL